METWSSIERVTTKRGNNNNKNSDVIEFMFKLL